MCITLEHITPVAFSSQTVGLIPPNYRKYTNRQWWVEGRARKEARCLVSCLDDVNLPSLPLTAPSWSRRYRNKYSSLVTRGGVIRVHTYFLIFQRTCVCE